MGKGNYSPRQPAPLMSWVGKALFTIVGFILAIVGINWLLKRGGTIASNTKNDMFSGVNSLFVGTSAGATLTAARKDELYSVADRLHTSMDGPGIYWNSFASAMEEIQTDKEYDFVDNVAFAKRESDWLGGSYTLDEWMSDEWGLTQSMKDAVNNGFASKGMTKRI